MKGLPTRYDAVIERCRAQGTAMFIPFWMLGDPNPETSLALLDAAIEGGCDALELGLPFSDPIADGPTVQTAGQRAMKAGVTPSAALELVRELRTRHPKIPIGLLTYANLVVHRGMHSFYAQAARCGIDSVLVADVPAKEAQPFAEASAEHGVATVLIAPNNLSEAVAAQIAALSAGYTYCTTRAGVTGANEELSINAGDVFERLSAAGAPAPVLGFGISTPAHVKAAIDAGAAGAISGSALINTVQPHFQNLDEARAVVRSFVQKMKAATERPSA